MTHSSKDPLHGKTLNMILEELVAHFGWKELGERIPIKCFTSNASIRSSLVFLRKTGWAREKVESLYLSMTTNGGVEEMGTPTDLEL